MEKYKKEEQQIILKKIIYDLDIIKDCSVDNWYDIRRIKEIIKYIQDNLIYK